MMKESMVMHFRRDEFGNLQKRPDRPEACGGITIAATEIDGKLHWGVARCHDEDNYNKKLGRIIAIGRSKSKDAEITDMMTINDFREAAWDWVKRVENEYIDNLFDMLFK